ncbi:MAG TPA: PAS domain S-box protein, partial [Candidatus Ozemobacteraceae bacterium]|nr:PAS domain S-box protein [Candidatus Ozemobacteraceae bacterium]
MHLRNTVSARTVTIAEQAETLRRSEEDLRITLHSIGDAVISTDTDGRIVRMNEVAEKLTGWSQAEAVGKPSTDVFRIVQGEARQQCANPVEKVLASGEHVELANHTVLVSRTGREYQIADSGSPIRDRDGQIVGVVLVFRDVTEQYVLEERLRQSQKLEAVGQLAGGVAHDFNNMLGGIIGGAELLEMGMTPNDEQRKALDIIINAAERARELTRKLLVFSRKGRLNLVPIDVHVAIRETVQILERTIDKRIKIEVALDAADSTINGDISQIQNALLNLGINASHAMPEGGTIRFATRNTVIEDLFCRTNTFDLKPGPFVDIEVRDTGCGIVPENLKRVFEPFFTTKGVGKGTG